MKKWLVSILVCLVCGGLAAAPCAATESSLAQQSFADVSSEQSSATESVPSAASAEPESSETEEASSAAPSQSNSAQGARNKPALSPSNTASFKWTEQLNGALTNADKWLNLNPSSQNYLIAAGIAGNVGDIGMVTRKITEITDKNGQYSTPEQLEQDILSIVYSSLNPTQFNGLDLIKTLYQFPGMDSYPLSVNAYALICYDSNNFFVPDDCANSRGAVISRIVSCQTADGGFASNPSGETSDIYNTAYALIALSGYAKDSAVQASIQNALVYLQRCQQPDGTFSSHPQSGTCSNLSQVICALCSLSISPSDARFVKNGRDFSDVLLDFQLDNGGFCEQLGQDQASPSATEASIVALVGMQRMANPYIVQNNVNYQSNSSSDANWFWLVVGIAAISVIAAVAAAVITIVVVRRKRNSSKGPHNQQ